MVLSVEWDGDDAADSWGGAQHSTECCVVSVALGWRVVEA